MKSSTKKPAPPYEQFVPIYIFKLYDTDKKLIAKTSFSLGPREKEGFNPKTAYHDHPNLLYLFRLSQDGKTYSKS